MNPITKKLADRLKEVGRRKLEAMNPDSACAKALQNSDREACLNEDVQRICNEISILEAGRIMKLSLKLKGTGADDTNSTKDELRVMASKIMERVEKKTGNLHFPLECRGLLLDL